MEMLRAEAWEARGAGAKGARGPSRVSVRFPGLITDAGGEELKRKSLEPVSFFPV